MYRNRGIINNSYVKSLTGSTFTLSLSPFNSAMEIKMMFTEQHVIPPEQQTGAPREIRGPGA